MQRRTLSLVDDERITAFGLFLEAAAGVTREIERDLAADAGIPGGWLGVLIRLARSPEHRMRMSDLAASVTLTSSGVTRLVDRIEAAGLITREACPSDRRVAWATLTPKGRDVLAAALSDHVASIQRHVVDRLGPAQYEAFVDALRALRDATVGDPAALAESCAAEACGGDDAAAVEDAATVGR